MKRKYKKNLYLYAETYNIISFLGARMLITKQVVNAFSLFGEKAFFSLRKKYFLEKCNSDYQKNTLYQ